MADVLTKRALISAYDKTGIVEFARVLVDEWGIEIISTGGTARALMDAGLPVTQVETVTGFPEMMDGRVKTLHPKIHAAILADRNNPAHMQHLTEHGIEPIDMVVVNLYPFARAIAQPDCTFEQAIEMIDIGGPCMLRAAAKNHRYVWPICSSDDFPDVLRALRGDRDAETDPDHLRARLAAKAFVWTKELDHNISDYLLQQAFDLSVETRRRFPPTLMLWWEKRTPAKYGENPHQLAAVYRDESKPACRFRLKDLKTDTPASFNNYVDANAALQLCAELSCALATRARADGSSTPPDDAPGPTAGEPGVADDAVCVFVKHTNACGVGVMSAPASGQEGRIEAYRRAYVGDPNAAMGGILACNFAVDPDFAAVVMETYARWGKQAGAGGFFVEVWIAPAFDPQAVRLIRGETETGPRKAWGKRVRLFAVGDMHTEPDITAMDCKTIAGGVLVQTPDVVGLGEDTWRVATRRPPTEAELADLRLAWLVCKHTKSNAITICKDGMLIGNGAGQMSRVMSCRIATWLAVENGHGDRLRGAVAASDAFFPFRDGPDLLAEAGVAAIIQPGGSKRDAEVVAACDERGLAMVLTGTRHFRH